MNYVNWLEFFIVTIVIIFVFRAFLKEIMRGIW